MSKLEELIAELCPNGVEFRKLGDIGQVKMCKRILKSQTNTIGGIPFYKIGTFGGEANSFISTGLYEEYKEKYSYPKIGEILISAAGTIGRTVVYDGEPAYYQDSNIVWLSHNESDVLNTFLRYCYELKPWSISSGGTIPRLYNDNILKAKIPVPPLEVQREIVRILDSFTLLTAELTARKKQYEYYRDDLLKFDHSIPMVTLGDVATVTKLAGFEFTNYVNYSDEGQIIALRGLNVKNGKLDLTDVKYIDNSDLSKLSRSKLHIGDMIFTYVGTIGQVALIDKEDKYYLAPNVALIRSTTDKLIPEYMRYYFQSGQFWHTQINRLLQSSSMKNIPMEKIRKFKLPLPPIETQKRLVKVLDNFDAICSDLNIGLPAEIEARQKQYEFYRDVLLTFAETGNIIAQTDRQTDRQTSKFCPFFNSINNKQNAQIIQL